MSPMEVIECTIGLFGKQVAPGKYPPTLAADIITELQAQGYRIESIPDPYCDWCGTAVFPAVNKPGRWRDAYGGMTCEANTDDRRHEPASS